jgi:hypothetical protein
MIAYYKNSQKRFITISYSFDFGLNSVFGGFMGVDGVLARRRMPFTTIAAAMAQLPTIIRISSRKSSDFPSCSIDIRTHSQFDIELFAKPLSAIRT